MTNLAPSPADLAQWLEAERQSQDPEAQYKLAMSYWRAPSPGAKLNLREAFDWMNKAAKQGLRPAQVGLAYMYDWGDGVERSCSKAVEWAQRAEGDPFSDFLLGKYLLKGLGGLKRDLEEAQVHFARARQGLEQLADSGDLFAVEELVNYDINKDYPFSKPAELPRHIRLLEASPMPRSLLALGACHLVGWGVPCKDGQLARRLLNAAAARGNTFGLVYAGVQIYLEAIEQGASLDSASFAAAANKFEAAVNLGNYEARTWLGACYLHGRGRAKDPEKAVEYFQRGADAEDSHAIYVLGSCYAAGAGIEHDLEKASDCYRRAAEIGWVDAQVEYAAMLCTGQVAGGVDYVAGAHWYEEAAKRGNRLAQYHLGVMYWKGQGVPRDDAQAVSWLEKAAAAKHPNALNELGNILFLGSHGVAEDKARAVALYAEAAAAGVATSQEALALAYWEGCGVEKDEALAIKYWSDAAAQGYCIAQHRLAVRVFQGEGVAEDAKKAVELFRLAAAQEGLFALEAQYALHVAYAGGKGVEQSWEVALEWLKKAADGGHEGARAILTSGNLDGKPACWYEEAAKRGHLDGQFLWGWLCLTEFGSVPQNVAQGVEWLEKAAAGKQPNALDELGDILFCGLHGVAKNEVRAIALYKEAAAAGMPNAQYMLGHVFWEGCGVEKDAALTIKYWSDAAAQGHHAAQYRLGVRFQNGEGVAKDAEKAVELFQKVAVQEGPYAVEAQAALYEAYLNGEGAEEDQGTALYWLKKAADGGHESAQVALRNILERSSDSLPWEPLANFRPMGSHVMQLLQPLKVVSMDEESRCIIFSHRDPQRPTSGLIDGYILGAVRPKHHTFFVILDGRLDFESLRNHFLRTKRKLNALQLPNALWCALHPSLETPEDNITQVAHFCLEGNDYVHYILALKAHIEHRFDRKEQVLQLVEELVQEVGSRSVLDPAGFVTDSLRLGRS